MIPKNIKELKKALPEGWSCRLKRDLAGGYSLFVWRWKKAPHCDIDIFFEDLKYKARASATVYRAAKTFERGK